MAVSKIESGFINQKPAKENGPGLVFSFMGNSVNPLTPSTPEPTKQGLMRQRAIVSLATILPVSLAFPFLMQENAHASNKQFNQDIQTALNTEQPAVVQSEPWINNIHIIGGERNIGVFNEQGEKLGTPKADSVGIYMPGEVKTINGQRMVCTAPGQYTPLGEIDWENNPEAKQFIDQYLTQEGQWVGDGEETYAPLPTELDNYQDSIGGSNQEVSGSWGTVLPGGFNPGARVFVTGSYWDSNQGKNIYHISNGPERPAWGEIGEELLDFGTGGDSFQPASQGEGVGGENYNMEREVYSYFGIKDVIGYWHTIKNGETLEGLSQRTGVHIAAIAAVNDLIRPDVTILHREKFVTGNQVFIPDAPPAGLESLNLASMVVIDPSATEAQREGIMRAVRGLDLAVNSLDVLKDYRDLSKAIDNLGGGTILIHLYDEEELGYISPGAFYQPRGDPTREWGIWLCKEYLDRDIRYKRSPSLLIPHELQHLLEDDADEPYSHDDPSEIADQAIIRAFISWLY